MIVMKLDDELTISQLEEKVWRFIEERNWGKYHKPKDIAESICIEAAELLELFQWRSHEEVEKLMNREDYKDRVREELADIIIYILSFAKVADIDLSKSIIEKIEKNAKKYPTEKYYGKAHLEE
ncbi:MAG: nucleotide pyrophosphohydrolase [archaeon YNP-LCB-003-016]|jgi:NTP pyrophosphatase (non-canonical NTP hydrolase)|nr:nucleotide pyrophosphohydrolase [Candidatus Culexarchaeum yellowstonense]